MNEIEKKALRDCYYIITLDGATIEKNGYTICSVKGFSDIYRFQVFGNKYGKDFFETYQYPDVAVDQFVKLVNGEVE